MFRKTALLKAATSLVKVLTAAVTVTHNAPTSPTAQNVLRAQPETSTKVKVCQISPVPWLQLNPGVAAKVLQLRHVMTQPLTIEHTDSKVLNCNLVSTAESAPQRATAAAAAPVPAANVHCLALRQTSSQTQR